MKNILVSFDAGVAKVSINRPDKKNSLTAYMYKTLDDAFKEARNREDIKVVHLCGEGGVFSAGNDITSFANANPNIVSDETEVMGFLYEISSFPKPIVAEVSGLAVGVGVTCLLHCDFVYANAKAVFAVPFVNLALCPEAASSYLLPQLVGLRKANELLLLGDSINAEQALAFGLINGVDSENASTLAEKTITRLLAMPTKSLLESRRLMRQANAKIIESIMMAEVASFQQGLKSAEAKEAFSAFFERRVPDFSSTEE